MRLVPVPYYTFCYILLMCIAAVCCGDERTVLELLKDCGNLVPSCEQFRAKMQANNDEHEARYNLSRNIEIVLLHLPAYPHQCYVHFKYKVYNSGSRCVFSGGMYPLFTKHNMEEATAVWNAAGTTDGLWMGSHRGDLGGVRANFRFACGERNTVRMQINQTEFLWAQGEPSQKEYYEDKYKNGFVTYINGSTSPMHYDAPRDGPLLLQYVCVAWHNQTVSTDQYPQPSKALLSPGSNTNTADPSDSADLTAVWVVIGLLIPIFLLTTIFIVYKKVRAKQDNKNTNMEKTARPLHTKRDAKPRGGISTSNDEALPQMHRNLLGRLHSNGPVSESSEVKSEGVPAVLGQHSTTASASGVHIDPQYDVHEISRVDRNRGKWDEAIDGQSAISGNTFPFSLKP